MHIGILAMGVAGGVIISIAGFGSLTAYSFIVLIGCALVLSLPKQRIYIILVCVSVVGGALRTDIATSVINAHILGLETGHYEAVPLRVVSEAGVLEGTQRFIAAHESGARIRVSMDRYPEVSFGDVIELSGVIDVPQQFETDTGREFNYPTFLHARGVTHISLYPSISVVGSGGGVRQNLFAAKEWFITNLGRVLPEPHASLVGGVTVGAQDSLGRSLLDDFRDVGLIHIVVLSGFNIAIVVIALRKLCSFLPRSISVAVAIVGVIAFALLVGGGATVIRASIMAIIGLLAVMLPGRHYDITRALLFAGVLMILWNPYILLFDPSFQLSFLATLGLIYLAPWFSERLAVVPVHFGIREIISATLATQVFVLPLLLYMSGIVSFTMVISNILVLPVIPTIMLLGAIVGIGGGFTVPIAFITTLLIEYVLQVVSVLAKVPTVVLPDFPLTVLLVVYGVYIARILIIEKARMSKTSAPLNNSVTGTFETTHRSPSS